MALARERRGAQVPLCHQVRVEVVVGDRAVLVGARDAVDPKCAVEIVVAEGSPEPRRLDEDLHAYVVLERGVVGGVHVSDHRVGDVRVDMEGRRAGRPVARALLAVDRPPRKRRTRQAEFLRALLARTPSVE